MTKRGSQVTPDRLVREGFAFHQDGDLASAERCYRRALKRDKRHADALYLLGSLHVQNGKLPQAEKTLRLALDVKPGRPEVLFNLARALMAQNRFADAAPLLEKARAKTPESLSVLGSLGVVRLNTGDFRGATEVLEQAVRVDPNSAEAWCDLGMAYSQGDADDSAAMAFDKTLSIDPNHARAKHNRGHLRLRNKDFLNGWPDYESRKHDQQAQFETRPFDCPQWAGEDLTGKTLLVWLEQGLGDQLLQATMLTDVIKRAGHVVLECEPRLQPLLARSFPTATVVATSLPPRPQIADAKPHLQCAGGSLGRWLRPSETVFSHSKPFLIADPERKATLHAELKSRFGDGLCIGLSWKSARAGLGPHKSTTLTDDWASVFAAAKGANFVSLQYGDVASDCAAASAALGAVLHTDFGVNVTNDIDGLAALIAALDVAITTSNTTAHIAGALGVPTWVVVPRGPARLWYWFNGADASPWYPSVKLYWQKRAGEWQPPMQVLADDLGSWIEGKAKR